MSKELELKTCPFCGQYAMMDPDIDPRDACTCDGAQSWRARCRVYEARVSAMEKLCGKECEKISAHYHPVGEETFALLKDVLHGVCFKQIGKVVIALTDGTALTLSKKGVRRVAKVDLELGQ